LGRLVSHKMAHSLPTTTARKTPILTGKEQGA